MPCALQCYIYVEIVDYIQNILYIQFMYIHTQRNYIMCVLVVYIILSGRLMCNWDVNMQDIKVHVYLNMVQCIVSCTCNLYTCTHTHNSHT